MSAHPIVFDDSIKISAPCGKVWSAITCGGREGEKSLCAWVGGPDGRGFFFQGGWRLGGEIKMFDDEENGAVVRVTEFVPDAHLKYEQIATLSKGKRDDSETEWSGISDEFKLVNCSDESGNAGTELSVAAYYPEHCRESLSTEFRRSMEKIKELAEKTS